MNAEALAQLEALFAAHPECDPDEVRWDPGAEVLRHSVPVRYPGLSWDRHPRVLGDEPDLWFAAPSPCIMLHHCPRFHPRPR